MANNSLTITDNRTGKKYEIERGVIVVAQALACDFRRPGRSVPPPRIVAFHRVRTSLDDGDRRAATWVQERAQARLRMSGCVGVIFRCSGGGRECLKDRALKSSRMNR
jgi:hypothetical protein